jgi:hypothetical protein
MIGLYEVYSRVEREKLKHRVQLRHTISNSFNKPYGSAAPFAGGKRLQSCATVWPRV